MVQPIRLYLSMEFSMAKKTQSTIAEYDENFVNSISLKNINSAKELKELLDKLEKADQVVTEYYRTLYTDHIMFINSSNKYAPDEISLENVKKYHLRLRSTKHTIMSCTFPHLKIHLSHQTSRRANYE